MECRGFSQDIHRSSGVSINTTAKLAAAGLANLGLSEPSYVKGQAIEFKVSADVGGTPIEFKFTGTLENKDSVKGKLDNGGLGEATLTGKRKEPEAKKP